MLSVGPSELCVTIGGKEHLKPKPKSPQKGSSGLRSEGVSHPSPFTSNHSVTTLYGSIWIHYVATLFFFFPGVFTLIYHPWAVNFTSMGASRYAKFLKTSYMQHRRQTLFKCHTARLTEGLPLAFSYSTLRLCQHISSAKSFLCVCLICTSVWMTTQFTAFQFKNYKVNMNRGMIFLCLPPQSKDFFKKKKTAVWQLSGFRGAVYSDT